MATYQYKAIDASGKSLTGTLDAPSLQDANNILLTRDLIPSEVTEGTAAQQGESLWTKINAKLDKVKVKDLILFTKQFRSMMNAGVPIVRIMQVLESQTENKAMRHAINTILVSIRQGASMSDAFEKQPEVFSHLYCSMLRSGELSGNVPGVLDRLIYIIEHEAKVKSDIKAALQYPMMVLIALGVAFVVLEMFVIPKFVAIFARTGLELPLPTQIATMIYNILSNYWYLVLGVIFAFILLLRAYFKTENGKLNRDRFLLRVPLIGPLFQKAAMSRFASIFAILQGSGVPVTQTLIILSDTIGNEAIARSFNYVRDKIQEGSGIALPLRTAPYFTPMVVDMIAIGEESGNIDEMLTEISKHYDDEVEYAVKALSDSIGPILVVGLAAVVGFFALAIFLPMWDMTKMVK
jgi:type II secretory pathway component PulF